jgi:hypothetical protein
VSIKVFCKTIFNLNQIHDFDLNQFFNIIYFSLFAGKERSKTFEQVELEPLAELKKNKEMQLQLTR